jgi:lipopolysaccharide heptosyltransferase II
VVGRILLIRLRQIGDVVFTTPAIRALHERYPQAQITYVVEPAAAPVVDGNPFINELVVAPNLRGLKGLRSDWTLGRRLRKQRFDLVIDFHGGPRASLLTWLSGAPVRIGYQVIGRAWVYTVRVNRPRQLRPRHSVENQWDLLAALGIAPPTPDRNPIEIPVNPHAAQALGERLSAAGVGDDDEVIVMHVSAGNPFRRWPGESFTATAAALVRGIERRRLIVTSGPSDAEAAKQVIDDARARLTPPERSRIVDCGEISLAELRALADRAAAYIGGDSGPMHVVSASTVPIVGLYGPTLPARSAPWRPSPCSSAALEVNDLPCRPCDQRVCLPGDFRCLTRIGPDRVVGATTTVIAARSKSRGDDGRSKM